MALIFYHSCFGGLLKFVPCEEDLQIYNEKPIVIGSLLADDLTIHGSDLVHDEGRKLGNYISIFISCKNIQKRRKLIDKLSGNKKYLFSGNYNEDKLIELTDVFDVRWVLGISDNW